MSKSTVKEADAAKRDTAQTEAQKPILIVAVGRQRVGKTTLLNALAEIYRAHGAKLAIWNADLHNRTHSLSLFHEDAMEPAAEMTAAEQKGWIEDRLRDQVSQRFDAILDVGGGLTALNTLVEEVQLVDMLARRGIRVVMLYVLGNERADLDYLERLSADRVFTPDSTIIVFNEGLLTNGLSAATGFKMIADHPTILSVLQNGGKVARMPSLSCMPAVTDRGLSFSDFAAGKQADDFPETSFFDQERVAVWLNRNMTAFFAQLPSHWLPATTSPLAAKV